MDDNVNKYVVDADFILHNIHYTPIINDGVLLERFIYDGPNINNIINSTLYINSSIEYENKKYIISLGHEFLEYCTLYDIKLIFDNKFIIKNNDYFLITNEYIFYYHSRNIEMTNLYCELYYFSPDIKNILCIPDRFNNVETLSFAFINQQIKQKFDKVINYVLFKNKIISKTKDKKWMILN